MDPTSDGCRLCLDPIAESFTTIDNRELKDRMQKVFCFSIEPKQGYCSGVCQSCLYIISEFYNYSEKVRQNQEVLDRNVTNCDPTVETKIAFESVKVETLSDIVHPETIEAGYEPKVEVLEEVEDAPISDDDKLDDPLPNKLQTKRKRRPGKNKLDDLEADEPMKKSKQTTAKTQQERNEEDQLFNKHFRMICDLCGTSAGTFTELRSHFKNEHQRLYGYVVCCNKKLYKRHLIRDHMDFHVNPDMFRCEVCGNKYKNKDILNIHMTNQHSGKKRTMVCDTCGKEFLTKQCFDRHMKEHMGIEVQRFQCAICQRWLKGERNLRIHMNTVHTDGNREFQCDVCLQKYPHIRALQWHKQKMHAEPKHECEFCGKKFNKAISLKEHRTTHTGEVLYTCEYCGIPKKRKTHLYLHIKGQHPTEWAQMKLMATQKVDL